MMLDDAATEVSPAGARDPMAWRKKSVCRQHPTQWWFAGTPHEVVLAKDICAGCSVIEPCLEFALARPELLGIWGATTPSERATMRRTERAARSEPNAIGATREIADALTSAALTAPALAARDAAGRGPAPERTRDASPVAVSPREPARPVYESRVDESDHLLTPAEAARVLGVTPNTVTRWSRAGRISAIRTMGGHRRFRRSDIERALAGAIVGDVDPS